MRVYRQGVRTSSNWFSSHLPDATTADLAPVFPCEPYRTDSWAENCHIDLWCSAIGRCAATWRDLRSRGLLAQLFCGTLSPSFDAFLRTYSAYVRAPGAIARFAAFSGSRMFLRLCRWSLRCRRFSISTSAARICRIWMRSYVLSLPP